MVQLRQANLRGCSVSVVAQQRVQQPRNPMLLDQLKEALRSRHYSRRFSLLKVVSWAPCFEPRRQRRQESYG